MCAVMKGVPPDAFLQSPQWQGHQTLPQTLYSKEAALVLKMGCFPTLFSVHFKRCLIESMEHLGTESVPLPLSSVVTSLLRKQECQVSYSLLKE